MSFALVSCLYEKIDLDPIVTQQSGDSSVMMYLLTHLIQGRKHDK